MLVDVACSSKQSIVKSYFKTSKYCPRAIGGGSNVVSWFDKSFFSHQQSNYFRVVEVYSSTKD